MTLWAKKSQFRLAFGDKWNIELVENIDEVEFIVTPTGDLTIDITSYEWSEIEDTLTLIGAETSEFRVRSGRPEFRAVVPRERLPDDYDD